MFDVGMDEINRNMRIGHKHAHAHVGSIEVPRPCGPLTDFILQFNLETNAPPFALDHQSVAFETDDGTPCPYIIEGGWLFIMWPGTLHPDRTQLLHAFTISENVN